MSAGLSVKAEWGRLGKKRGFVSYPHFVDATTGQIIVTEKDNNRIQIFDRFGKETRFEPFATRGHGPNQLISPSGVTTTKVVGASVIVADTGNERVCVYRILSDKQGYGILDQTHAFGHYLFKKPSGVAFDDKRNTVVVSDVGNHRVTFHDVRNGACIGELRPPESVPFVEPIDVAIDNHGRVYVTDGGSHFVHIYDKNGDFITHFGGPGSEPGQFKRPWGLCFDRLYNVLITDQWNNRIQMFGPDGQFVQVLATDVHTPRGISCDVHEDLVVMTGDAENAIKILKYKS